MLSEAFRCLNRNLPFLFYPLVFDAAALAAGLWIAGFTGEPQWSLKLLPDIGLPSVSDVLNVPQLGNTISFLRLFGEHGASVPAAVVLLLLLLFSCFATGGYIDGLRALATEERPDTARFWREGRAAFIRFAIFRSIVFLAKTGIALGTAALFGTAGLFFSLLVFFVLRVLFVYVEYAMVVDRLTWDQALKPSREYFNYDWQKTGSAVTVLFGGAALFSLLLHRLWSPEAAAAGIVVYAYWMTGAQLMLMKVFLQSRAEE